MDKFSHARRCGFAIAKMEGAVLDFAVSGPLHGEVQTVARAEVMCLSVLLDNVVSEGVVEFITDWKPLKEAFDKGQAWARDSPNKDLMHNIFQQKSEKNLTVSVAWIPSHADKDKDKQKKLPEWVTPEYILGNSTVDTMAGNAAKKADVPAGLAAYVISKHAMV